jgi:hypothetical protein
VYVDCEDKKFNNLDEYVVLYSPCNSNDIPNPKFETNQSQREKIKNLADENGEVLVKLIWANNISDNINTHGEPQENSQGQYFTNCLKMKISDDQDKYYKPRHLLSKEKNLEFVFSPFGNKPSVSAIAKSLFHIRYSETPLGENNINPTIVTSPTPFKKKKKQEKL